MLLVISNEKVIVYCTQNVSVSRGVVASIITSFWQGPASLPGHSGTGTGTVPAVLRGRVSTILQHRYCTLQRASGRGLFAEGS